MSWLDKFNDGETCQGYNDFYSSVGAVIMGAYTYEKALTLSGGIDGKMPTYVATHRKLPIPGDTSITFYSGALPGLVHNIMENIDKDIWLVGGGILT